MSKKNLLTAASLILALSSPLPVLAHADHGKPQHGGVVAEAGEAQFEIVRQEGKVLVYASEHGVPLSMAGGGGKLTVLAGAAKSEIVLKPLGDHRLQGEGKVPAGAKLLLSVQLPGGKTLQARSVAP